MQKYRKKPVEIDAIQLHMSNMDGLITQMRRDGYEVESFSQPPMRAISGIKIKTLEGVMLANFGDWIIKGVQGEYYPCKPDIFEKTNEPVVEDNGE